MTDVKGTKISVRNQDITEMEVDAIAHGINNYLWMGSGVAGAIRRKGGIGIVKEALEKAPLQIGSAIVTGGGSLKVPHVIHAAIMGRDLTAEAENVEKATRSALDCARELGVHSLALSAFGTGIGGFPVEESARVMFKAVRDYLDQSPGAFEEIFFVIADKQAAESFKKILDGAGN